MSKLKRNRDYATIPNFTVQQLRDLIKAHDKHYYLKVGENRPALLKEVQEFYKQNKEGDIEQSKGFDYVPPFPVYVPQQNRSMSLIKRKPKKVVDKMTAKELEEYKQEILEQKTQLAISRIGENLNKLEILEQQMNSITANKQLIPSIYLKKKVDLGDLILESIRETVKLNCIALHKYYIDEKSTCFTLREMLDLQQEQETTGEPSYDDFIDELRYDLQEATDRINHLNNYFKSSELDLRAKFKPDYYLGFYINKYDNLRKTIDRVEDEIDNSVKNLNDVDYYIEKLINDTKKNVNTDIEQLSDKEVKNTQTRKYVDNATSRLTSFLKNRFYDYNWGKESLQKIINAYTTNSLFKSRMNNNEDFRKTNFYNTFNKKK